MRASQDEERKKREQFDREGRQQLRDIEREMRLEESKLRQISNPACTVTVATAPFRDRERDPRDRARERERERERERWRDRERAGHFTRDRYAS